MIPNFKWSQTNETISITAYYDPSKIVRLKGQANIKLEESDITPRTKDYDIDAEWLHLSWNDFKLDLHLREDVKPKKSWCKWKEEYVFCSLVKKQNHIFDYLSTRDQIADVKRYGTKDWEATTVGEAQEEFLFDDNVNVFTAEDLKKIQEKKRPAIVRAFYPWCGHCHEQQEAFVSSQRDKYVKKKKFKFGVVDAREDREAAKMLRATCSKKCLFTVYYKGQEYLVEGKGKRKEFVEELSLEIEDPYIKPKNQAKVDKIAKKTPIVCGYFEDEESDGYKKFIETAKAMKRRKDFKFALLPRENPNWAKALTQGANRVVLKTEKRKYFYTSEDFATDKNFTQWVDVYGAPLFGKYSYDLKKKWESVGLELPILKVFLDEDEPPKKLNRKIKKVASDYREQILFLWYPKSNDHMMTNMGLQKDDKPAFGISTSLKDDDAQHYAYDGKVTEANIVSHINAFLEKKAIQTFKTQRDPYAAEGADPWKMGDGNVQTIVHTTFEKEIYESPDDLVLMMYKNWTTNKAEALDAFGAVALLMKSIPNFKLCQFDYHENFYDFEKFSGKKHDSHIQVYYYSGPDGDKKRVDGPVKKSKEEFWTIEGLIDFIAPNHPSGDYMKELYAAFLKFEEEKKEAEAEEGEVEKPEDAEDAQKPEL